MGLLNALVESADRFQDDLLPVGYAERNVTWIINLDPEGHNPPEIKKQSPKRSVKAPAPLADRTRGVSPVLLVDTPSYVLGLPDTSLLQADSAQRAFESHGQFSKLVANAHQKTSLGSLSAVSDFLGDAKKVAQVREAIDAKKNELIAFQVGSEPWPTDDPRVREYWISYVERRLGGEKAICVACGDERIITRLSPFKLTVLKGTDPVQISSFNEDAFRSLGKTTVVAKGEREAAANAALCQKCASIPGQVLQYLLKLDKNDEGKDTNSGRHAVVLARDSSGGSKWKRRWDSVAGGGEKVRHRDQIKARRAAGVNSPTSVCVWISVVSDGSLIREADSFRRWLPICGCDA